MLNLKNLGINFNRPMSPPSSPKTDRSDKSHMSSDMPKGKNYPTPHDYAKAMEKYFGYDMNELHDRIKILLPKEQAAIIDNSHEFRRFLGITDPNSLKNKVNRKLQLGSSSRIKDIDAPESLAIAATRSSDPKRVQRSLERLDQSLQNIRSMEKNGQIKPDQRREATNRALTKLAQELDKFPTKESFETAVRIFEKEFQTGPNGNVRGHSPLSNGGLEEFINSVNAINDKKFKELGVDDKFKKSLQNLSIAAKNFLMIGADVEKIEQERIKAATPQHIKKRKEMLKREGVKSILKNDSPKKRSGAGNRIRFSDEENNRSEQRTPEQRASERDRTRVLSLSQRSSPPTPTQRESRNHSSRRTSSSERNEPRSVQGNNLTGTRILINSAKTSRENSNQTQQLGSSERKVPPRDVKNINSEKSKALNPEFSKYAELVLNNEHKRHALELEKNHLPLIAKMENERNQGLNLRVYDNAERCYNRISQMQSQGNVNDSFRFIYPPNPRMPNLYIALDVKFKPGKPASITAFDGFLELNRIPTAPLKIALQDAIKDSTVELESSRDAGIRHISLTGGTDFRDSMMMSLDSALKSFRPGDAQTSISVDDFRLNRVKGVQNYLSQKDKA